MYKIIVLDSLNQVLDVEFYQTRPNDRQLEFLQIKALKQYKTNVIVKTEIVKYIELGQK